MALLAKIHKLVVPLSGAGRKKLYNITFFNIMANVPEPVVVTGYCVKCRAKDRVMKDAKEVSMKGKGGVAKGGDG